MKPRHYLTPHDIQRIRQLIETNKLQQWLVAEMIGVHPATIEKLCRKLGLQTQRTGPRSGEGHTNWKGGRTQRKGYWYSYRPDHPYAVLGHRYVAEHRLVMEEKLGRYLLPSEVVHHIDKNRENNDPANLIVFGSNAQHLKHELAGQCPNWTPEGREKTLAARRKYQGTPAERARQAIQQYESTHPNRKRGAARMPQTTDHPSSQSDSKAESPY